MYQKIIIKDQKEYIGLFGNCLSANKAIKEAGRLLRSLEHTILDSQLFITLFDQLKESERLIGVCERDGQHNYKLLLNEEDMRDFVYWVGSGSYKYSGFYAIAESDFYSLDN